VGRVAPKVGIESVDKLAILDQAERIVLEIRCSRQEIVVAACKHPLAQDVL